jgi:hypothetical protein
VSFSRGVESEKEREGSESGEGGRGKGERGNRIFDQRTRNDVPESPMSNIYRQINKSERSVIRKSKVMAPRELMTGDSFAVWEKRCGERQEEREESQGLTFANIS